MNRYLKLALWIIIYFVVSFGIGQATQGSIQGWYQDLQKPSFNPPNWIFPVMWSILYVTIATAGWRLWQIGASKDLKIIFITYTVFNWLWTPIFFGLEQITIGLFWIIAINIINFTFVLRAYPKDKVAALLMMPVLCWTLFAMLLNYKIWELNG